MFPKLSALHTHLISSAHRRLTVICPWCLGKERSFTRVGDLAVHVKSCHSSIDMPKDVFTRGNCFYFAKYPMDYARICETVNQYEHDAAYFARAAVRKWTDGFGDRKKRAETWNAGWKAGLGVSDNRKARSTSRETSRVGKDKEDGQRSLSTEAGRRDKGFEPEARSMTRDVVDQTRGGVDRRQDENVRRNVDGGRTSTEPGRQHGEKYVAETRTVDERRVVEGAEQRKDVGTVWSGSQGRSGQAGKRQKQNESDEEENSRKKSKNDSLSWSVDRDLMSYPDDIHLDEVPQESERAPQDITPPASPAQSTSSESSSSSSSSEESACMNESSRKDTSDTLKARATKILMRGCMPLCPPAARDWSVVEEFSIENGGTTLTWPPTNWRRMSQDQKLLAHEYAAMFMEHALTKKFPMLPRILLLDKYNFLSLEGAQKLKSEVKLCEKADGRIRHYNQGLIRGILRGEVEDTRTLRSIVSSLENGDRWTDTDIITDKLDEGGLKMRL